MKPVLCLLWTPLSKLKPCHLVVAPCDWRGCHWRSCQPHHLEPCKAIHWYMVVFGNLGKMSFWPNFFAKCILLLCAQYSLGPKMFNSLIFTLPGLNICVTSSGPLLLEFPGGGKTAMPCTLFLQVEYHLEVLCTTGTVYVYWHGQLYALNQLCNQVLPQALHFKLLKSIIREKQSNQSGFKIINYSSPRSEAMLTVMIWDYICGRGRFLNMLPILGTTLNKLQLAWSTLFAIKMINVTWTPYTDDPLALCPSWRRKLRILLL